LIFTFSNVMSWIDQPLLLSGTVFLKFSQKKGRKEKQYEYQSGSFTFCTSTLPSIEPDSVAFFTLIIVGLVVLPFNETPCLRIMGLFGSILNTPGLR
jgi:hypothetical protein